MKVWGVSMGSRPSKYGIDFWKSAVYKKTYCLRFWGFGKGYMVYFTYA